LKEGWEGVAVARAFDISASAVSAIRRGRIWRDVR
jgi:hypothetical protein